jgi:hypothetical protein
MNEGFSDIDKLDEWLSTPIVKMAMDPILFWDGMLSAGSPLSRMGLDFLSIPGTILCLCPIHKLMIPSATSTDVEQAFSKGGLTVSRFWHSLSDKSTCTSTVLGSWAALDEIIPDGVIPKDEVIEEFKNKHRRPKKRVRVEKDESETEVMNVD